jgi:hypothetical protein
MIARMPHAVTTTKKERRRAQLRKARARYYERHRDRLRLVRKIDSILIRQQAKDDDNERFAELLSEIYTKSGLRKLGKAILAAARDHNV